jgi:hypothetical protein
LPFPPVLAHIVGGGTGIVDDIVVFGGIALIIGALVFLSWRAGRERQRREGRRRRRSR